MTMKTVRFSPQENVKRLKSSQKRMSDGHKQRMERAGEY